MTAGKTTVAVLDDEPKMRSALRRLLSVHGFHATLFETGDEFIKAAQLQPPDCLLLDLHMPGTTGFDVLRAIPSLNISVPVIVITGNDETGNAACVRELGAADYLVKPLDASTLLTAIRRVCSGSPRLAS